MKELYCDAIQVRQRKKSAPGQSGTGAFGQQNTQGTLDDRCQAFFGLKAVVWVVVGSWNLTSAQVTKPFEFNIDSFLGVTTRIRGFWCNFWIQVSPNILKPLRILSISRGIVLYLFGTRSPRIMVYESWFTEAEVNLISPIVAPMFWREMFLSSSNFDWIGYWEKKTENPHTVFVIYFMIPMYIYI